MASAPPDDIDELRRLITARIIAEHSRVMTEWDDAHFFPELEPMGEHRILRVLDGITPGPDPEA